MDRLKLKEKAIKLRRQGKTYIEIKKELGIDIPKSTLSNWCSNIKLPKEYQDRIQKMILDNAQKGRNIALIVNRVKREKYLQSVIDRNKYLTTALKDKNTAKIALTMLYLGEGAKWKSHRGLMLGNSNPNVIKLYIGLLYSCYGIKIEKLKCRINYRADQNISSLQKYWSHVTCIPLRNFYKTKPDPRTIGKPTQHKDYKGVCVLTCGGTEIQLELETISKLILKGI